MQKPPGHARVRRSFARTLRELRQRARLSQEDLAHAATIDRGHMSALERGIHTPSIELLFRLAKPLGVSAAEFMAELENNLRHQ